MNDKIFDALNILLEKHDQLLYKTYKTFHTLNLEEGDVETIAIDCTPEYSKHKRDLFSQILTYRSKPLIEDKVLKLFDIKMKRLDRHTEYLSIESIGTTLILLEEFWVNLLNTFRRNEIK